MIAHVAQIGEDSGRVVVQLGSAHPSTIALEAAVRIAQAFHSEIESVFVEDSQLFDCAAYSFVREEIQRGTAAERDCGHGVERLDDVADRRLWPRAKRTMPAIIGRWR
jgi:hypothetical protein